MVESQRAYMRLRDLFTDQYVRRVYESALGIALVSGALRLRGIDQRTLMDAHYTAPALPWIDPQKEITADVMAINNGLKSRHQVIRERGGDPQQVDNEAARDSFEPITQPQEPITEAQ
jgi:capsid protein